MVKIGGSLVSPPVKKIDQEGIKIVEKKEIRPRHDKMRDFLLKHKSLIDRLCKYKAFMGQNRTTHQELIEMRDEMDALLL